MDFFANQERARRHSRQMVVFFVLAVLAIIAAVDLLLIVVLNLGQQSGQTRLVVSPGIMVAVSLAVAGVIGLASLFRLASLRGGGGVIAREVNATLVPPDTTNPAWRRLRNVIEEVAIASGVPVPEIYVLEKESGINAFAAGYSPADAAVCVTQGSLDNLTRDELQGVISHEFSHVIHGDMRLNIRLMGVVFGIVVLSVIGQQILQAAWWSGGSVRIGSNRGRRSNGGGLWALGLGLVAIGAIGVFFARLIKASVARQRESLADASAVQFTRQTAGIAGALKKIGALEVGSSFVETQSEEVSHMLFGEAGRWSSWFATHPPLEVRIRTLQPGFDVREFEQLARRWSRLQKAKDPEDPRATLTGMIPTLLGATVMAGAVLPETSQAPSPTSVEASVHVDPATIVSQVGTGNRKDHQVAATIHSSLPEDLRAASRVPAEALSLVLALALAAEPEAGAQQTQLIGKAFSQQRADQVTALTASVRGLHAMQRLPLAALAFPALRRLPRAQIERLVETLQALAHADGRVELDEYCLATLVRVQILDALNPAHGFVAGSLRLTDCRDEFALIAGLVARFGHDDSTSAKHAFLLAIEEALPGATIEYAPSQTWQEQLDVALVRLDRLNSASKELVVRGLTRAICEDDMVRVAEAELLRVVCAALHCPLPIHLQGGA